MSARRLAWAAALVGLTVAAGCGRRGVAAGADGALSPGHGGAGPQRSGPARVIYSAGGRNLVVEILRDDLVHFAVTRGPAPDPRRPLPTSPMVRAQTFPGPRVLRNDGAGTLATAELTIAVDRSTLCATVTDTARWPDHPLTTMCPRGRNLSLTRDRTQALYGLGEDFVAAPPGTRLGWLGSVRTSPRAEGNVMTPFQHGDTGNAQFPILYAVGPGTSGYAVFVDTAEKLSWNFRGDPLRVSAAAGGPLDWYLIAGPDLPHQRRAYMRLVGRPPVPPKKAFGLWISEYGFDSWSELEDKLRTLRAHRFPVDGFVMDLQWFGGIDGPHGSQMGSLTWDRSRFPSPAQKIAALRKRGIGLMLIEESYVDRRLPIYARLARRGFLVRACKGCGPARVDGWWGQGGMIDWSNPAAAAFWHETKRRPLVDMGILGHWTDLGEPELYDPKSWFFGFPRRGLHGERDVHNLYNFLWSRSIWRGYARDHVRARPLSMSRSGTSGSDRFGVAMWSGDIGSDPVSLAAHIRAQGNMSLSGIDYYGSDVGGFHRHGLTGKALDALYTRWFADSALLDVPLRPHTKNLCNCKETAPDRVGDMASNLANVRLRYRLIPYLYSLAHRAYRYGDPVVAPLVFYYQRDVRTRQLDDEKLIGRDLLVATASRPDRTARDVYLPAGTWVDIRSRRWHPGGGAWLRNVPLVRGGRFELPVYARAGAIIPEMRVTDRTQGVPGAGAGLVVAVYASRRPTRFMLYEDDGASIAYRHGAVRTTAIAQRLTGRTAVVTVAAARGSFAGAPAERDDTIRLVVRGRRARAVDVNGAALPRVTGCGSLAAAGARGFCNAGNNLIVARAGARNVRRSLRFRFELAPAAAAASGHRR